jgi:hypothetical protein
MDFHQVEFLIERGYCKLKKSTMTGKRHLIIEII